MCLQDYNHHARCMSEQDYSTRQLEGFIQAFKCSPAVSAPSGYFFKEANETSLFADIIVNLEYYGLLLYTNTMGTTG